MTPFKSIRGCVSFSLFGKGLKYSLGMLENLELMEQVYPGWVCRVYLEQGHEARDTLIEAGADVIDMPSVKGVSGMFWRFLAADDPTFDVTIFRDADSRISQREAMLVEEWVESEESLHVIQDHPQHKKPIMGGMWGIRNGAVPLSKLMESWRHNGCYGDDEDFLARAIWPTFRNNCLRHDFRQSSLPTEYIGEPVLPVMDYDRVFGLLESSLIRRIESYDQSYRYATHVSALDIILRTLRPTTIVEFGGGHASTPLLISTGAEVFTYEQGQNVPERVNEQWLRELRRTYSDNRNWKLIHSPGRWHWESEAFPEHQFCFVDGNGDCRKEIVEHMLANRVPVIAAHDSESRSFRYREIRCSEDYRAYDFRRFDVWTRIWSAHSDLNAFLDDNPDFVAL